MAKQNSVALTARDFEILTSLDRTPLTPRQLEITSQSFDQPFSDEALARRRLGKLRDAGFVQSFPYSLVSEGRAPKYWKLTRAGYRLIYGADANMPSRRYFSEVPMGNHFHTHSIAAVIAHIVACGKRHGIEMDQFARENSFKLQSGQFQLYPDAAFRLIHISQPDRPYSFVLELDNGTERVRSNRDIESLERKIRGYDVHQSRYKRDDPARYLVLFVTTRSQSRLDHVLQACGDLICNAKRTLFLGTTMSELMENDPFEAHFLRSNNELKRPLIPGR